MAHSFTNVVVHLVFSTKDRTPLIAPELREPLHRYIGGVVRGERGLLLAAGGVADHLHLLARFNADRSVATMARLIKANSSRWMNQRSDLAGRFAWQVGYGAFSVSESGVPAVTRYIHDQEARHERMSFEEELVTLLERHGIAYDERYLLG